MFADSVKFIPNNLIEDVVWGVIFIGFVASMIMFVSFAKEDPDNQVYSQDDIGKE